MCQFVSRLMGLEFFSFMSLCSSVVLTFKPFIRILQNFVWMSYRLCQLVMSNILRSVITTWQMREMVLWQWQCCKFGVYKGCMVTIFEKYSTVDQVILLCRSTVSADIFLVSVLWRWAGHVGCAVRQIIDLMSAPIFEVMCDIRDVKLWTSSPYVVRLSQKQNSVALAIRTSAYGKKLNLTLEQAVEAQRGSRNIALLCL
jgi:hypothetical protein